MIMDYGLRTRVVMDAVIEVLFMSKKITGTD
jgi:hypothetical protein